MALHQWFGNPYQVERRLACVELLQVTILAELIHVSTRTFGSIVVYEKVGHFCLRHRMHNQTLFAEIN